MNGLTPRNIIFYQEEDKPNIEEVRNSGYESVYPLQLDPFSEY